MEINQGNNEQQPNLLDGFNLGLLLYTINKSLLWVILFIIVSSGVSHIYLRYTPKIYESTSSLMLKSQKTTRLLGVADLLKDDQTEIAKEIQLLRSRLIIEKAVRELPVEISYFKVGKTLFFETELYKSSPFRVEGEVKDKIGFEVPIHIEIIDRYTYNMSFAITDQFFQETLPFDEFFDTPYFSFKLSLDSRVKDMGSVQGEKFYFKFNDMAYVISKFINQISVLPLDPKTQTVKINLKDENQLKAKDIVNSVTNTFIDYDEKRKEEGVAGILKFLNEQIDTFGKAFYEFQDTVKSFRIETGFVVPEKQVATILNKINNLEAEQADAAFQRSILNWLNEYVENASDINLYSLSSIEGDFSRFRSQLIELSNLQKQKSKLKLDVTEAHPAYIQVERELRETRSVLKSNIESAIEKADYEISLLQDEYRDFLTELYGIPDKEYEYARLMRQRNLLESFYLNLTEQRTQYQIAKAGIVSDYVILERPTATYKPIYPSALTIRILGFVSGLVLGIVLIIIRYLLHQNIVSILYVEKHTDAPIIGIIPKHRIPLKRSAIVVTQNPKSLIAESFRAARSNLHFLATDKKSHLMTVTSTVSGEGKTFVAINFAAILSLTEKKVVLIDLDMRKPRIAKVFNADSTKGLSTILSGQSDFDDCIQQSEIDNLHFITSGPVPPNPSELVMRKRMTDLLDYLHSKYDFVLVDTPPVGLVTDALEVIKKADLPIYVLRADYSRRQFLEGVNKLMRDNRITKLSIILNDFGRGASGKSYSYAYGYDYDYGYGYGYGYSSSYGYGYYTDEPEKKGSLISRLFKKE